MTTKCTKNHSGNKTLHRTAGGWMECAGCGALYGEALWNVNGDSHTYVYELPIVANHPNRNWRARMRASADNYAAVHAETELRRAELRRAYIAGFCEARTLDRQRRTQQETSNNHV